MKERIEMNRVELMNILNDGFPMVIRLEKRFIFRIFVFALTIAIWCSLGETIMVILCQVILT